MQAVVPVALQEPVGQHAPAPALLFLPCGVEAEVVGRGEGGWVVHGRACNSAARWQKGRLTSRACKRTAAQDWHAEIDALPVIGLYVPCAMARRAEENG